ncbi:hypothetical protein K431DRAFT_226654 [Polychaeton citri CBS 116435]|uniref:Altered inheritance of mitochondria protein 11 n=1 Tax=Polychaeton citri CBS 116435 TaxID=1314669 RepID=A0A9P4ULN7_9PEZI|nr:hypothetical protein K431DRAFT_226654 [Polychaeton citri CBS 116435]
MSWWDKYLAPGDVRAQHPQQVQGQQGHSDSTERKQPLIQTEPARIDPAHRWRRQNALFFGGIAFTCLSLFVTRRSLIRKRISTSPKTFTPSNPQHPPEAGIPEGTSKDAITKGDGALDAAHALGLATLNVFSFFLLSIGAGAKYFDIADMEDLRDKVRRGLGFDVYGGNSNADKEIEGWVAEILARKDEGVSGIKEGVAEALAKMQEKENAEAEKLKGLGK